MCDLCWGKDWQTGWGSVWEESVRESTERKERWGQIDRHTDRQADGVGSAWEDSDRAQRGRRETGRKRREIKGGESGVQRRKGKKEREKKVRGAGKGREEGRDEGKPQRDLHRMKRNEERDYIASAPTDVILGWEVTSVCLGMVSWTIKGNQISLSKGDKTWNWFYE